MLQIIYRVCEELLDIMYKAEQLLIEDYVYQDCYHQECEHN